MATQQYASKTKTTKQATIGELEALLTKHGATAFVSGTYEGSATIAFRIHGLNILMHVPLPQPDDKLFTHTPTGQPRHRDTVHAEHQTAVRATWRALLLFVKAKLVGVAQGLTTIEQEFLPHIVLPNNQTVGDLALSAVREAYATGTVPPLLPGFGRPAIEGK